jgi:hypothetical protein
MTAQPDDFAPVGAAEPAKSLRAIRAALVVPQDRDIRRRPSGSCAESQAEIHQR